MVVKGAVKTPKSEEEKERLQDQHTYHRRIGNGGCLLVGLACLGRRLASVVLCKSCDSMHQPFRTRGLW